MKVDYFVDRKLKISELVAIFYNQVLFQFLTTNPLKPFDENHQPIYRYYSVVWSKKNRLVYYFFVKFLTNSNDNPTENFYFKVRPIKNSRIEYKLKSIYN